MITVYALYFVGVLLGADFFAPALDQQIPVFAFAGLTIFSGVGAYLVARLLKKTANPSRNVWIAVIVVFAFFLVPIPSVTDPIAAALLLALVDTTSTPPPHTLILPTLHFLWAPRPVCRRRAGGCGVC